MTDIKNKPSVELIERLYTERFEIEDVLVVFSKKGASQGELAIGMSEGTDLSWFLKAKEWVTWVLYSSMTGYRLNAIMEARRDMEYLKAAELEKGQKPS